MEKLKDPSAIGRELLVLLRRQKEYYEELNALARRQRELISTGRCEDLLSVLGERQKIVTAIGKVHREALPYQEAWNEIRDLLPADRRSEVQAVIAELRELLDGLLKHDREDCDELVTRKKQIAEQLTAAVKGREATQAYAGEGRSDRSPSRAGNNFEIRG